MTGTPSPQAVIGAWWHKELGNRERSEARALAARLRRASDVEALLEPQVHDLAARLGHGAAEDPARLARIARILADLRGTEGGRFAAKLGSIERERGSAHLRFQRIQRAEGAELEQAIRRVLPLLGRACDPGALGADLLFWGDRVRTRWAFDYFGATAPAEDITP